MTSDLKVLRDPSRTWINNRYSWFYHSVLRDFKTLVLRRSKLAALIRSHLIGDHHSGLKALANEDTLLRTHCCPWCFLGCANWEKFIADTKCFWTKSETFFVSRTQICVRNKCCACGQTGKHLCRQQCVRNNVSSFARALTKEQTTETMDPSPKTKELRPYPRQWSGLSRVT